MNTYLFPFMYEPLAGRIGSYWLEGKEVKYKCADWTDRSPVGSAYTNYERTVTIKVLSNPDEQLVQELIAREAHRKELSEEFSFITDYKPRNFREVAK